VTQPRFYSLPRIAIATLFLLSLSRLGHASAQPLPPDEAFKFKVSLKNPTTLVAEIIPAKRHYLYKDKTRIALRNASGVSIRQLTLPVGEQKNDPYFGLTEVYKAPVRIEITLDRAPTVKALTVQATYQGCNEQIGLCYPPIEKAVEVKLTR
jgi:thiol:disulfide interchange protein